MCILFVFGGKRVVWVVLGEGGGRKPIQGPPLRIGQEIACVGI